MSCSTNNGDSHGRDGVGPVQDDGNELVKEESTMGYQLEGRLLEVCNCEVLCPCWIGEDADNGTCDSVQAWHIDQGTIDGVDVSGRIVAIAAFIPGNVLKGNWKVAAFVDDGASDEQQEALLAVWTGKRGGPVADLAQLFGEVGWYVKHCDDPLRVKTQTTGHHTPAARSAAVAG